MCAQMPCLTDSDCHTRCGDHLIHGEAYVCVKNAFLYTYAGVGNDTQAYYIQEPGDDQFDVKNWNTTAEHLGTCMVRLPSPPPPPPPPPPPRPPRRVCRDQWRCRAARATPFVVLQPRRTYITTTCTVGARPPRQAAS